MRESRRARRSSRTGQPDSRDRPAAAGETEDEPADSADRSPQHGRSPTRFALPLSTRLPRHPVVLAVAGYVAVRLLMLATIVLTAHARGQHAAGRLSKADGYWYLLIAAHGYGHPPPIGPDGAYTHRTTLAFFPLYPTLIRAVSYVGMPRLYAALLITAVAGTFAAAFITWWAQPYVGDRGAVVLTIVWSLLPTSVVFDMAYSEGLFVAAAAATLLALQRDRLVLAALACTVAGLTRPTGAGLVAAVLVALVLDVRRSDLRRRHLIAALLAPAGLALSLGHVAVATGRVDGWFWLEKTVWHSGFDGGWSWLRAGGQLLTGGPARHEPPIVMSLVVVVAFVAAFVAWVRRRPPAAEVAYTATAGILAIGERNFVHVKPRFLLVAYPVLVPVARRMARWSTTTLIVLGVAALAASLAWNTYLVLGWPKSV